MVEDVQMLDVSHVPTPADELRLAKAKVVKACLEEIQVVLIRHGCKLQATPQFIPDGAGGFRIAVSVELAAQ